MNTTRKLVSVGAVVLVLGGTVGVVAMGSASAHCQRVEASPAEYEQLRGGMTRGQVEHLFGGHGTAVSRTSEAGIVKVTVAWPGIQPRSGVTVAFEDRRAESWGRWKRPRRDDNPFTRD